MLHLICKKWGLPFDNLLALLLLLDALHGSVAVVMLASAHSCLRGPMHVLYSIIFEFTELCGAAHVLPQAQAQRPQHIHIHAAGFV